MPKYELPMTNGDPLWKDDCPSRTEVFPCQFWLETHESAGSVRLMLISTASPVQFELASVEFPPMPVTELFMARAKWIDQHVIRAALCLSREFATPDRQ